MGISRFISPNSKLFQNPKKIEKILLILFLLPGTPKDLLSYIAGLLPIKPARYIVISSLARFPSVISSTLAGANIAVGNWKISILIYLITFAAVGLIIFIMNKFDKSKVTEETSHIFVPIDGFTDVNKEEVIALQKELVEILKSLGIEAVVDYVDKDKRSFEV